MLAHSPPLPIIIDHLPKYYKKLANCEEEEGILVALKQRDRVRHIRLIMQAPEIRWLIAAIDEEFPMLEYLCITPTIQRVETWVLPTGFRAPRLRYLMLTDFVLPIRSPLLTTEAGLVTLTLDTIHAPSYFSPDDLLERLSLMHHLQSLTINFSFSVPDNDARGQLLVMTHVTLPNLRSFAFQGESPYLEALIPHVTTPLLEKLRVGLFDERALSVPHLLQFIITTECFTGGLRSAVLRFNLVSASVMLYPDSDVGAQMYSLCLSIQDSPFDWQVVFAAHVFDVLRPVLSEVAHLTLEDWYRTGTTITESTHWHNQADRADWRKVLGPFINVTTLSMHNGLVAEVSRSLQLDDGEQRVDLLPRLNKLECYGSGNASDAFTAFIDTRKNAGRPVTLIRLEHFPIQIHGMKTIRPEIPPPF